MEKFWKKGNLEIIHDYHVSQTSLSNILKWGRNECIFKIQLKTHENHSTFLNWSEKKHSEVAKQDTVTWVYHPLSELYRIHFIVRCELRPGSERNCIEM